MNTIRALLVALVTLAGPASPVLVLTIEGTPVAMPDSFSALPTLEVSYAGGEFSETAPVAAGRILVSARLEANVDRSPGE